MVIAKSIVSILVLMDVPLESSIVIFPNGSNTVSILVLMDVPLELGLNTIELRVNRFQSLF